MWRHVKKISVCIMMTLLVTACQSSSPATYNTPYNTASLSTGDYLQLADIASGSEQNNYRLLAAKRALQNHQAAQAKTILNKINPSSLSASKQTDLKLLYAQTDYVNHAYSATLNTLAQLNAQQLTVNQQWRLHQMSGDSYAAQQNLIAATDQFDALFSLTDDAQRRQQIALTIWQKLQTQTAATLNDLATKATNNLTQGWLTLAAITKQTNTAPAQYLKQLMTWQKTYPDHPARVLLNTQNTSAFNAQLPQKIALLLPLSGKLEKIGKAIQDGFFAAYYATRDNNYNPTIQVFNTADQDIHVVYQKALAAGCDFIVGPLTKTNLQKLVKNTTLSVPTLALNRLDQPISSTTLYQFGLSPIDATQQIANRIWNEKHYRVLIIAPQQKWGQRIVNAFTQDWTAQQGHIASTVWYGDRNQLSNELKSALNIDKTYARKNKLQKVIHEKLRFVARRRKDFDAIFVVANNDYARQIVPLLKFYFAGNVATYSLSTLYPGNTDTQRDRDLDYVFFNDSPWLIDNTASLSPLLVSLRQQIKSTWPAVFNENARLTALGVDSYLLISALGKMALLPQFGMSGATGRLYLLKNNEIYRQLQWAQIQHGRAKQID